MGDDNSSRGLDVAHVCVMPSLLLIGLLGQTLNLLTLRHRSLSSLAGLVYLRAGAVADILSIIALIPFVVRQAKKQWSSNYWAMWYHAHLELPLVNSLITASTLCIVGLTVQRYLSMRHPLRIHNTARKGSLSPVIALYLTAFAIFAPSAWQKNVRSGANIHNDTTNQSALFYLERDAGVMDSALFQTYLMLREQSNSIRVRREKRGGSVQAVYASEQRIHVLLLITCLTFVLCTLPASLLSLFVAQPSCWK